MCLTMHQLSSAAMHHCYLFSNMVKNGLHKAVSPYNNKTM